MKIKDLKRGEKFSPTNNPNLKCEKGSKVIGKDNYFHCKTDIGWLKLPGELEVI